MSGLRAGCAQSIITPPPGGSLAGYFHLRTASRVRDDLYARALILENGSEPAVLVSLDLAHVAAGFTAPAAERIAMDLGIPAGNVMISATHTHTGPEVVDGEPTDADRGYVDTLPGIIADTVRQAWDELFPARICAGRESVHGYSYNRLFRLRDGREVFGRSDDAMTIGAAGPIDPELVTLSILDREGSLRGLVVSFALHVDVIGGGGADFLSADWPGELARVISAAHESDVVTLFLQGASGDINHVAHEPTSLPQSGPPKARQLGRALAGAAMLAAERAEPMSDPAVASRTATIEIPYYTRDPAIFKEVEALKATTTQSYFDEAFIRAVESWTHDNKTRRVPVQVMRLGDMGMVALPAEIFSGIGLEIKRFSPFDRTMIVALANDRASVYVPTLEQAARGAYGARPILSRRLCADAGQRLSNTAIALLHELAG